MKPVLRDPRTGVRYPVEVLDEWGQNGVGDGYGPQPIAFHLVEDARTGAMQAAGRKGGFDTPLAVEMVADSTPEPTLAPERFARGFTIKGRKVEPTAQEEPAA